MILDIVAREYELRMGKTEADLWGALTMEQLRKIHKVLVGADVEVNWPVDLIPQKFKPFVRFRIMLDGEEDEKVNIVSDYLTDCIKTLSGAMPGQICYSVTTYEALDEDNGEYLNRGYFRTFEGAQFHFEALGGTQIDRWDGEEWRTDVRS